MRHLLAAAVIACGFGPAQAVEVFTQGFESDFAGFFDSTNGWHGTITLTDGTTEGVTPFQGSQFAVMTQVGTATATGPYTLFGGVSAIWPGGWTARAAVFIDTGWDDGSGFDWSVASSRQDGAHLRDFIFHVAQVGGDTRLSASNNSNFAPQVVAANAVTVGSGGWHVFEHVFRDDGGVLAVDMNVYDAAMALIFSTTRSNPSDTIADVVGGNLYGWFTHISVDGGIYVDGVSRSEAGVIPVPAAAPLLLSGLAAFAFLRRRRAA